MTIRTGPNLGEGGAFDSAGPHYAQARTLPGTACGQVNRRTMTEGTATHKMEAMRD